MTPQEKAKELVDKFYQFFPLNKDVNTTDGELTWEYNDWGQAKQCALIAVDEMMNQFNKIQVSHIINGYITYKDFEENLTSIQNQLDSKMISKWSYWQQVKEEIEKL